MIQRVYSWDTFVSQSSPPSDSGTVAVLDGCLLNLLFFHRTSLTFLSASILLTPFRSQNVPPPMSSYQLVVSPDLSLKSPIPAYSTPVYVTFSPENDAVGILWEHGHVEIWLLKTRLLPGPGKIMDPSKFWGGIIHENKVTRWRQVAVRLTGPDLYSVTVLGTAPDSPTDTIALLSVQSGNMDIIYKFQLPFRNCRLLTGSVVDTYQGPDGTIFRCESYLYHGFLWKYLILVSSS